MRFLEPLTAPPVALLAALLAYRASPPWLLRGIAMLALFAAALALYLWAACAAGRYLRRRQGPRAARMWDVIE